MRFSNQLMLFGLTISLFACNEEKTKKEIVSQKISYSHPEQSFSKPQLNSPEKSKAKVIISYKPLNPFRRSESIRPADTKLIEDLRSMEKKAQDFYINPNLDTLIVCNEGTRLKINKGSFVKAVSNDSIVTEIKLSVKEFYQISDMVLSGLSTQSNEDLLETGGMLFIEARSDGEICDLKKGSTLEIGFPYQEKKDSMQLFTGVNNNGNMKWLPLENQINFMKDQMDRAAEFPDGIKGYHHFLSKYLKYPPGLSDIGNSEKVLFEFEIDERGKPGKFKFINTKHPEFEKAILKVFGWMPDWNPAFRNGNPIVSTLKGSINFIGNYNWGLDSTNINELETRINDSGQNYSVETINAYLLNSARLGWINCDRFYQTNNALTNLVVECGASNDAEVHIIFHSFKSVFDGTKSGAYWRFKKIPVNEKITIVAIKKVKEKILMSIIKSNTNVKTVQNLKFEEVSLNTLKEKLELLNHLD